MSRSGFPPKTIFRSRSGTEALPLWRRILRADLLRRGLPLVVGMAAILPLLAGCEDDGRVEGDARAADTTEAEDTEATDPVPPSRIRGDSVEVEMDEYLIDIPDPLPPGSLVFRVLNTGFEEHNLEVHRDSLLWELQRPLNPGEGRTMEVVLEPGSYRLICTVSGHEGRGMTEELTVVEGSGSS